LAALNSKGTGRILRIFIGEHERVRGKPLYTAIVMKAKEMGLAGATVLRGIEGFGAGSRAEGKRPLKISSDPTVVIEIIDHPDRIAEAVPAIHAMVPQGLIVVEEVQVLKYAAR
jgi:PII-like signaling protein